MPPQPVFDNTTDRHLRRYTAVVMKIPVCRVTCEPNYEELLEAALVWFGCTGDHHLIQNSQFRQILVLNIHVSPAWNKICSIEPALHSCDQCIFLFFIAEIPLLEYGLGHNDVKSMSDKLFGDGIESSDAV